MMPTSGSSLTEEEARRLWAESQRDLSEGRPADALRKASAAESWFVQRVVSNPEAANSTGMIAEACLVQVDEAMARSALGQKDEAVSSLKQARQTLSLLPGYDAQVRTIDLALARLWNEAKFGPASSSPNASPGMASEPKPAPAPPPRDRQGIRLAPRRDGVPGWNCPQCGTTNFGTGTCEECGRVLNRSERRWVAKGRDLADFGQERTHQISAPWATLLAIASMLAAALIALESVPGLVLLASTPPASVPLVSPIHCAPRSCLTAMKLGLDGPANYEIGGPLGAPTVTYLWFHSATNAAPSAPAGLTGRVATTHIVLTHLQDGSLWLISLIEVNGTTKDVIVVGRQNATTDTYVVPIWGLAAEQSWVLSSGPSVWSGRLPSVAAHNDTALLLYALLAALLAAILAALFGGHRTVQVLGWAISLLLCAIVLRILLASLSYTELKHVYAAPPTGRALADLLIALPALVILAASLIAAGVAKNRIAKLQQRSFLMRGRFMTRVSAATFGFAATFMTLATAATAHWWIVPR